MNGMKWLISHGSFCPGSRMSAGKGGDLFAIRHENLAKAITAKHGGHFQIGGQKDGLLIGVVTEMLTEDPKVGINPIAPTPSRMHFGAG